ncbi:pyroglutamyl-peptidase I [Atopobiaceae bacterium 24-176]
MKVLVTAFEPFGGQEVNASWLAASALPDVVAGASVARLCLPCVFGAAGDAAVAAVDRLAPDIVIACGEHRGSAGLAIERVALNVASTDVSVPDEAGQVPVEEPLAADGPGALVAALPLEGCVRAAQEAGIPAHLSCSAGLYVCNSVMFALLDHRRARMEAGLCAPAMAGFVHVPATPVQACRGILSEPWPSMETERAAAGLVAVLEACVARLDAGR